MKKLLQFLLLLGLLWPSVSSASHLMGGEITWRCNAGGQFVFTCKLYRDCNGIPGPATLALSTDAPVPGGTINCNLIQQNDLSPSGPGCPTCNTPQGQPNAVEEFIFRSAPVTISGVPPAGGWGFWYIDCCRNIITNLPGGSGSFTLRAKMFPYNGTNTSPCYDSSPVFAERPQLATCPKNRTAYNANAYDENGDSLVYDWGQPLDNGYPGTPYTFAPGYAYDHPLPGPAQNPLNETATICEEGVVQFLSYTPGTFNTVTKVTAYKCGIKIAEVYREIQIAILSNCILSPGVDNTPPVVTVQPVGAGGPPLQISATCGNTYIDTVQVGDTVRLVFDAFDYDPLPPPNNNFFQSIKFEASGLQFDQTVTGVPCKTPPCATMVPTNVLGQFFSGAAAINFEWPITCDHLPKSANCVTSGGKYTFVVKVFDNYCPAPAVNFNTLVVFIKAPPPSRAARPKCADVVYPDGDVKLTWEEPLDTLWNPSTNQMLSSYFLKYYIYRATNRNGPYTLIDSLTGVTNTTYTDTTVNSINQQYFYYLTTSSLCDVQPHTVSDTIGTMHLTVAQVGTNASLAWTPLFQPNLLTSSTQKYYIYRESSPPGSNVWSVIDSTTALVYLDPVKVCNDSVNYRIEVRDTSTANCISHSNVTGDSLQIATPNITPPSLRCLSVQPNGDIIMNWVGSIDTASKFVSYEIYQSTAAAGPFTKIGSVSSYGLNTFTHTGANGQTVSNYYYITTKAGCDIPSAIESPNSDTLRSMLVSLVPSAGLATVSWNAPRTPLLPSAAAQYSIYRKVIPGGVWQLAGTTAALTFQDVITLCDTNIIYQVKIADNSGCINESAVDTDRFTSLGVILANAQPHCLAVQPNGDVMVSWSQPADPTVTFGYNELYSSTNAAGPYTLVATVNPYATTSYMHVGAAANIQARYYYIKTYSGCNKATPNTTTPTSDTLATMHLTLSNATVGSAIISWNAMHNPQLASVTGNYIISKRSPNTNTWTLVGNTNLLTYTETITQCNVPYVYKVELADNLPCTSVSNIDSSTFTYLGNIVQHPTLRCVSVNNNGTINLSWENATANFTNFSQYKIYRDDGLGFSLLASINSSATNTYTDGTANGNAQPYSYYLITMSGCTGNEKPPGTGDTLSSIYLTTSAATVGTAQLNWTALAPVLPATTTAPKEYNITTSYNGPVLGDTTVLTYSQPVNDCDTTIWFQVIVNDQLGCSSRSNIDTNLFTAVGNIVANPDLRCVSVANNGQIQLTWLAPTGSNQDFNKYDIWRNDGTGFVYYASVNNFNTLTYTDAAANGNNQSYSYYMLSKSGCTGQVSSPANSQTLNSIYLDAVPTLGVATMNWNALPLSAGQQYDVYSSYIPGTLISTANLQTTETISNCDTTLIHYASVADASGCVSKSNQDTNLFTYLGNVVNNPDLRCVSVANNGQIQLTWIAPTGSNVNFNKYDIWRNDGTGFVYYASVNNFNTLTYTDAAANGNNQSYSYYMLSKSGCTGQVSSPANSQTLNSIYIDATPSLGFATMNWNALPLSAGQQYDVYSSYVPGNLISTVNQTVTETISNCDTSIMHYASVADASGCVSKSNQDTNVFTYLGNVINNPELRCANVLANGQVQLSWLNPTPGSWVNFDRYEIYSDNGSGWNLVTSLTNNGTSSYTDVAANANAGAVNYTVITKSGCTGQVTGAVGDTLSTIFLDVTGGNTATAQLNWNAQRNPLLPSSSSTYNIERKINNGAWTAAGTTNTTSFSEPLLICIDSVFYRVSISDNLTCTSTSNVDVDEFVDHTVPVAPLLTCASVQTDGSVVLNWIASTDTARKFNSYQVFASNNPSGPFVNTDSLFNYNTLTVTDPSANANAQNQSMYYYLETRSGCGGELSLPGDTLQTMKLNVLNANGIAVLNWNPVHNPELPSASNLYTIYREYPAGTWTSYATTNTPTYSYFDTINVCQAVINYRVETSDVSGSGCVSSSSTDGDLFRDLTKPVTPQLDTVSVDPANPSDVTISWLPSSSGDVVGYILYLYNGASWDSIGGSNSAAAGSLAHLNPAAAGSAQTYSIAAFDSCGNISNIGAGHNTMHLTTQLDICRSAIDLFWNPYLNMVGGVSTYNVFVSENNGPLTYLASVPGNTISYSHTTLTNGSTYCYYIQAQGNVSTRTASSNSSCTFADLLTLPTFSYLKHATVIDNRRARVEAYVDTVGQPDVSRYKLQRSYFSTGPFSTVGLVNYVGDPIITFDDFTARTDEYSYYYRVVTIDSCGNDVLISNLGRTILLGGSPEYNLTNKLGWNEYSEWLGGVKQYVLFRKVDDVWSPVPAGIIPFSSPTQFLDDVSAIYPATGRFCYRIEAYEDLGNTYGFTDTSVSNEFCLIQEPHLYVPNAFTPGGKNPVLKPEYFYTESKNYFFAIYNRWGQKVFETADPTTGWDGTYNGSVAPEGSYVYSVRIFGTDGKSLEKNGTVTLLR